MTPFASVAILEKLALLKIAALQGPRFEQGLFRLLARGVVGADQQIADDCILSVAQRRDRHDRREAAAVLADVGQLVDVLDPARGFEDQCLEARRDRGSQLEAQRFGARDHFLWIRNVGRGDLVHHIGGYVAQHALRADVEYLNDAFLVGGDTGEVGAVENRGLQGPCYERPSAPCDALVTEGILQLVRANGARLDQYFSQLLDLWLHMSSTSPPDRIGISLHLSLAKRKRIAKGLRTPAAGPVTGQSRRGAEWQMPLGSAFAATRMRYRASCPATMRCASTVDSQTCWSLKAVHFRYPARDM